MSQLKYKRVLLKLSGEALAGEKGYGLDPDTVSRICRELADALGGQLAFTRPMVEDGFGDTAHQIGLSGRTVRPKLIITCGVSGAVQFSAGMNNSECIVAINSDEKAGRKGTGSCQRIRMMYWVYPQTHLTKK